MLDDARAKPIIKSLLSARRKPGIDHVYAAETVLIIAAMPAETFISSKEWRSSIKKLKPLSQSAKKFRNIFEQISQEDISALQHKANIETDFSRTRHILNAQKLIRLLGEDLKLLIKLCDLPEPPDTSGLVNRKSYNDDSKKMIKARLLKREIGKLYERRLYKVIADMTTLAENLSTPMSEKDVEKA
jgi:hypothetical protein